MLSVIPPKSRVVTGYEKREDGLYLFSEAGRYRLTAKEPGIVRITYTQREAFSEAESAGVTNDAVDQNWSVSETEDQLCFATQEIRILIQKGTASFVYCDAQGKRLLSERETNSKELEEFPVYRIAEGGAVTTEKVSTADGEKTVVRNADKIEDGTLFHTRLWLDWQDGEALYGLGQHEEGIFNLRGQMLFLHQGNRKIAVPMLVSGLGYGILMDTYSPMIFSDTAYGSYLYTEADEELDYYFILGPDMDGVIKGYRRLTGKAAMLPRWAFGYLQSQERYETSDEILAVAEEYRKRGLGLDAVVLDWCSWEDGKWGQKSFDAKRFPDPAAMVEELHKKDVHFMMSIWPNMSANCEDFQEFKERGLLLPGCEIYNALSEEGRQLYWKQVQDALYNKGVDAWWCDSSEPVTPEWNHFVRQEPVALYSAYCRSLENHLPTDKTNAYCLYHAQALYEGQRSSGLTDFASKRVMNLTRSGYTGQQRYGTVLWSGDTGASWDTLRRQIAAGLNFCASGLPYWTTDIGAFFVKHGAPWYWDGDYNDTTEDMGYRELYVRWSQWECFLPVFRGHGTDCRRELWQFGGEGDPFYDALVTCNRLRYEFMPCIYTQAGLVWLRDESLIRLLAFAFPEDPEVHKIADQYLFGNALMVCPVTQPMYYEACSAPIESAKKTRRVYLPQGGGWYDYWTDRYYEGGQWIEADATLEKIPLFVREGSILTMGRPAQSAAEATGRVTLRVYAGRDASCELYEDAGDGYGYENGEYALTRFVWSEKEQRVETSLIEGLEKFAKAVVAETVIIRRK